MRKLRSIILISLILVTINSFAFQTIDECIDSCNGALRTAEDVIKHQDYSIEVLNEKISSYELLVLEQDKQIKDYEYDNSIFYKNRYFLFTLGLVSGILINRGTK